jgi:hypothetical protein
MERTIPTEPRFPSYRDFIAMTGEKTRSTRTRRRNHDGKVYRLGSVSNVEPARIFALANLECPQSYNIFWRLWNCAPHNLVRLGVANDNLAQGTVVLPKILNIDNRYTVSNFNAKRWSEKPITSPQHQGKKREENNSKFRDFGASHKRAIWDAH